MFTTTECRRGALRLAVLAAGCAWALAAQAQVPQDRHTGGKLLLTGGVNSVEGTGGGGLTPWALIGGYGESNQIGANAFTTRVELDDFALDVHGVLVGFSNRVEVSFARQRFDTRDLGAALGLGRGFRLEQDVLGAKVRLFGDAVLEQDSWLPQVALGAQYKTHRQGDIVRTLGVADTSATDVYLSATKLFLAQSLLVNGTVRYTKANQFGILGHGGDRRDSYRPQLEGSVAWLLNRHIAVGGEFRTKPDNLGVAGEDAAWDVFVAWAPSKHVSVTAAWVDLGNIVVGDQRGAYLSLQIGF
ncbi:MAG: DUF3034 family protein [Lysobacteraceae bacterium]